MRLKLKPLQDTGSLLLGEILAQRAMTNRENTMAMKTVKRFIISWAFEMMMLGHWIAHSFTCSSSDSL